MDESNSELIKAIVHYQQCLEKYTRRNNEPRMLYCISKLYKMPITVEHLEQTGVGRTVNSLRKFSGEVGDAAKSLVAKWKEMVVGEDIESKDSSIKPESSKSHREESKNRKHKEGSSSSSHKERDSSSFSNGEESHSKKAKDEFKYKKSEENYRKDKDRNHYKHRSPKRKQSSDNSESDDNKYEKVRSNDQKHKLSKRKQLSDNSESDDSEQEKIKSNTYKHKPIKHKIEEIPSEDENHYKVDKDKRDIYKQKLSKRKREDSDCDDKEYKGVYAKCKKYSEDEEEPESEVEQKEIKTHSHKYESKPKDETTNLVKEKNKHSSTKYKIKKEKKKHVPESKPKKYDDEHKIKDKQLTKDKVKSSSEKRDKEENGTKCKQSSSKHRQEKEYKSSKKSSSNTSKDKVTVHENGIGSGSGTSFAEALGMLEPSSSKSSKKKIAIIHPFPVEKSIDTNNLSPDISKVETSDLIQKRLEPLDINISNLLPEITPNYRPIGNLSLDNGQTKNKATAEEEALSAIMYSKISRTKVYSGNKVIYGNVPTLFDLCTHVLQDNIDALEYTGGVPYLILKPVIERANPDQLFMLEHHNPYLIEDTDELWQLHCQKEFRTKKREEMETWRDMYMRCLDEREAKLKALTANIKQSQDKSLPVRQTKLAYVDGHSIVKPPRSIARKQAKHGTAGVEKKPLVTPSSRLCALATAGAAGQIAVPNPGSRAATAAGSSSAVVKPKKAPLMQKTLAFMKNRLFRR